MKDLKLALLSICVLICISSCRTVTDSSQILEDIQENLDFGNLSTVVQITDSLKKANNVSQETIHIADSLEQIAQRIGLDFSVTESEVTEQLRKLLGGVTDQSKTAWENNGWLEWRMIDGGKKYFNRAASNLLLIKKFHESKKNPAVSGVSTSEQPIRLANTGQIMKESEHLSNPAEPVKMEITYTLTVHPDAVPEGEKIRCWLPWPKSGLARQNSIKLTGSSEQEYTIAPDTAIHSTIYMEKVAKNGVPTIFQISWEYTTAGQYFNMANNKILPYAVSSANYLKYTSEQFPHICFTDEVRRLADSICGDEKNPREVVRKIYLWFKENITWTGALEYSTIPNIPEYVIKNRRGDCGMQTFLLLSMLRYRGVPARWQSGWEMSPGQENLHDWSEVYYEGTGWVPVDVTYNLQNTDIQALREFFISGIDSYRLIVNNDVAGPLHPAKEFLRSEPNDFQRGEVEWKGGNLYFDKWDYDMKIKVVK
jgi:hypothetical protein